MNDLIDTAQLRAEEMLQNEIDAARKHVSQSPKATGKCLFCDEPLDDSERRFCDKYCAADAEKYGTMDGGFIPLCDTERIKRGQRPNYLIR